MTRRDIIIVAVLVNAGLLAILFMLAITTDDDHVSDQTELTTPIMNAQPIEVIPQDSTVIALSESQGSSNGFDNSLKTLIDSTSSPQTIVIDDENDSDRDDDLSVLVSDEPMPSEPQTQKPQQPTYDANQKFVEIKVKKGDSLDKIARANGATVKSIKDANQLKNDKLSVGQKLRVPVGSGKPSSNNSTAIAQSSPSSTNRVSEATLNIGQGDAQYYTIKNGDNPWKIAKQFNIKVADILKLNNMDEDKAKNMKVGDRIRIR